MSRSYHGISATIVLVFLRALSSIINTKSADGMTVKCIGGTEAKNIQLAKKSIKTGFVIEINKRHQLSWTEHQSSKLRVIGSSPIWRTNIWG